MRRIPVKGSSNVAAYGYDIERKVLHVEFLPKEGAPAAPVVVYEYTNVPSGVFEAFKIDESKGSFVHRHLKRSEFGGHRLDAPQWIPDPTDVTLEDAVTLIGEWQARWRTANDALISLREKVNTIVATREESLTANILLDLQGTIELAVSAQGKETQAAEEQVTCSSRAFLLLNQTILVMRRDIYEAALDIVVELQGRPQQPHTDRIRQTITELSDLYASNREAKDVLGDADWNWRKAVMRAAKRAVLRERQTRLSALVDELPLLEDCESEETTKLVTRLREYVNAESHAVMHPDNAALSQAVASEITTDDAQVGTRLSEGE